MKYICNPMNLPYRYQFVTENGKTRTFREAADPTLIRFRDTYWLFPSMTAGFYTSDDLADWTFHSFVGEMPITAYAPDVCAIGDWLYFCASTDEINSDFFRCRDPRCEAFERIPGFAPRWDPKLFWDDDGRLYFYWGCSNQRPLYGVELNPETMQPLHPPVELLHADTDTFGFERRGENHVPEDGDLRPWIEGAWMTRHNGKYYLQYAAPGTEYDVYCDAVAIADGPLGPFRRAANNPFSYQPGGFANAAGHGSTIKLPDGSFRHISTMRISHNHMFERRLGIWNAGFDRDGELFCDQRYGDWPRRADASPWTAPEWMLLSYGKSVRTSSGSNPEHAADENIRTWWTAQDDQPWLEIDLGRICSVHAVQVNFADDELQPEGNYPEGRMIDMQPHHTRWLLEGSCDGKEYFIIEDKRNANTDLPHDLIVREDGFACRYVRLHVSDLPFNQPARISGLRVFGHCEGSAPGMPQVSVQRSGPLDMRIQWAAENAVGANILWGHAPDKLYHSCLVFDTNEKRIGALTAGEAAYVRVDAFNECGITEGETIRI